jgi:hypothetical protein
LVDAHLENLNLRHTMGFPYDGFNKSFGNAKTRLPTGVPRPSHWPPEAPEEDSEGAAA